MLNGGQLPEEVLNAGAAEHNGIQHDRQESGDLEDVVGGVDVEAD